MNENNQSEYSPNITLTKEGIRHWISRPYVDPELSQKLGSANLLLVPQEGFRDFDGPVFPTGTADYYQHLVRTAPEGLVPEICVADADYREIALHADWLLLASVVATVFAAPLAVRIIGDYISDHFGSRTEHKTVKTSLTIVRVDNEKEATARIDYDGPAEQFETSMGNALDKTLELLAGTDPEGCSSRDDGQRRA